jgi:hypothetical protein
LSLTLRAAALAAMVSLLGAVAAPPAHAAATSAGARPAATEPRPADDFWNAVAARVGVSPDALRTAVRDVRAESLGARRRAFAEALARSLGHGITADRVVAAFERARDRSLGPDGMLEAVATDLGVAPRDLRRALKAAAPAHRMVRMHGGRHLLVAGAARYLGMPPAALREALAKGQSLAQVARARGKSPAGLERALRDAAAARIHEMVETPWPTRPGAGGANGA